MILIAQLTMLSTIATIIASVVGVALALLAVGIFSLFLVPQVLVTSALAGALFSLPVTFVFFPISAWTLRNHRIILQFVLPVVGFIAGGLIMSFWFWSELFTKHDSSSFREIFVGIGMVSGLTAGAFYGRGFAELRT